MGFTRRSLPGPSEHVKVLGEHPPTAAKGRLAERQRGAGMNDGPSFSRRAQAVLAVALLLMTLSTLAPSCSSGPASPPGNLGDAGNVAADGGDSVATDGGGAASDAGAVPMGPIDAGPPAGFLGACANRDGGTGVVGTGAVATGMIGPEGGWVGLEGVSILVPPGALQFAQALTITSTRNCAPTGFRNRSPIYTFEPEIVLAPPKHTSVLRLENAALVAVGHPAVARVDGGLQHRGRAETQSVCPRTGSCSNPGVHFRPPSLSGARVECVSSSGCFVVARGSNLFGTYRVLLNSQVLPETSFASLETEPDDGGIREVLTVTPPTVYTGQEHGTIGVVTPGGASASLGF